MARDRELERRDEERGTMEGRALRRPREGRLVAGVCAGLARHFGLNPTMLRVVWALLVLLWGTGILAYLICWILIPEETETSA